MNIQQAKQEIKHTLKAYLAKDEQGNYLLSPTQQRPLLLMGAPGIGKTQIMRQIAQECEIGLVSYTITHHTRQSAVGLPMICQKEYNGHSFTVTEYTMSEIIASVYEIMEQTGLQEGILFIDEINCVSETLAPTMLQFLQNKTFGNQSVPQGWVIVAAGNPPEYNKSVREFDVVTLDRLRKMEIQPDLSVWKKYAHSVGVHSAVLTYLEIHPEYFYRITQDVDGIQFVTARGWEDLSSLLKVYESMGISAEENIVSQYLQHTEIAEDFAAYLSLYQKYGEDYQIESILNGNPSSACYAKAQNAGFDERLTLVGLLLAGLEQRFCDAVNAEFLAGDCFASITAFKSGFQPEVSVAEQFQNCILQKKSELEQKKTKQILTRSDEARILRCIHTLEQFLMALNHQKPTEKETSLEILRTAFAPIRQDRQQKYTLAQSALENAFDFLENAFDAGQELLMFVTELGMGKNSSLFLSQTPCERYIRYTNTLLLNGRTARILKELAADRIKNRNGEV